MIALLKYKKVLWTVSVFTELKFLASKKLNELRVMDPDEIVRV